MLTVDCTGHGCHALVNLGVLSDKMKKAEAKANFDEELALSC